MGRIRLSSDDRKRIVSGLEGKFYNGVREVGKVGLIVEFQLKSGIGSINK